MIILVFIIGLVFGSFYMVVGLRLPVNESIVKPGSHCENCNHELKWYELIPILSYIIQGGKCSKCGERISFFYVLIELLTGALFALCYYLYGISYEFFAGVIVSSVLIIIIVSDFKYKLILDSPLVIGSIFILILKAYYFGFAASGKALGAGIFLFLFMLFIRFIGNKMFKKESLGGGDIKLSFFTGCVLGILLGLTSLVFASFLAFPYAFLSIMLSKDDEIPFGPFLAGGLLIVYFFMEPISNFLGSLI